MTLRTLRDSFIFMGRGIEARFARCERWWAPHIACTQSFLKRYVQRADDLLVLGAGRLLDVDMSLLLERCQRVHLYDADPGCLAVWKKRAGAEYGRRIRGHIADCTEVLGAWSADLTGALRSDNLEIFLRARKAPQPLWEGIHYDGIISLNLLGQIPLYWRDLVIAARPTLTHAELEALALSMGGLQLAHLDALQSRGDAWSILLTDSEYYFYDTDNPVWRVESALFGNASRKLHEVYNEERCHEKWLWHVSPQYVECDDEGEIHRVEGFFRELGQRTRP